MTYDEVVNTILEYYMLGDFPGWTMTDTNNAQMRRVAKDGRYEFVELTDTYGDENIIIFSHLFINLEDYSEGELWHYGSMYYATKEDFEDQGADIVAECVFEQTINADAWGNPEDMLALYVKTAREE